MPSNISAIQSCVSFLANRFDGKRTLFVGISGAQGSGKTTFTTALQQAMESGMYGRKWHVLRFSLDDYYLSHAQRRQLSEDIHPLLQTRGVPGTHHIEEITRLFDVLGGGAMECSSSSSSSLSPSSSIQSSMAGGVLMQSSLEPNLLIPRFDKSTDNPFPKEEWTICDTRPEVVLFEGWCVGAYPQPESDLCQPVNDLERNEDADGRWRGYVNAQLAGPYRACFDRLDVLLMLQVPSFEKVYEWRLLQEQCLQQAYTETLTNPENLQCPVPNGENRNVEQNRHPVQNTENRHFMSADEIKRFVSHYERITRHILEEMPSRADMVLKVGEDHELIVR